ncbi:MAG: efflux transporter outer membrane subunit, partial [Proteobacteria bacterium]|nr:efflux transporter outer membrane subunit [Pseudomonadota bacterium]
MTACTNYFGIYSTKKIAPPSQFASTKSLPAQQGKWPNQNWARQFDDRMLVQLINEALENNPSLAAARARILQARSQVEGQHANLLPSLNLNSTISRGLLSENLLPPTLGGGEWFTFSTFLFRLNYEIDIWGKNLASLRKAMSEEKVAIASSQEARLTIAASVATTYNELAYYYALSDVLRKTVIQRESLNKITHARLVAGLDTRVQLYQSRNTTATARTQLLAAENEIVIRKQQLGTLLGKGPDRCLTIPRPHLAVLKTAELPANLPLNLLGRRPDIVGARWQVEAYCQGIKNAKAQFYPNVNLSALAGLISLHLNNLFQQGSQQYQAGPAFSLPVYDGGTLRANLKNQYANYEEAVANYNSTLNNAISEVAKQITTIKSLDKQILSQNEALNAAIEAYNLARAQYRIGLTSQLTVLDAETRLLEEQQSQLKL